MKIIRSLSAVPFAQCIAAIGNFDGVHLGHQTVLADVKALAQQYQIPAVAILFEPQPIEFFRPSDAPARLTNLREKLRQLAEIGIDAVFCIRFQQAFADLSPEDFIKKFLVQGLGIKALFVGEDFRFGKQRQGSIATLRELAPRYDFSLGQISTVLWQQQRVSSTRIRVALQQAEFDLAAALLGRPYHLEGRVIHGDKRGQQIGFATANIALRRLVSPLRGVYAVRVHGLDKTYYGVANIGNRPTVDGLRWLIETHIFDFNQTIYGRTLRIEPLTKLRDEKKFANIDALMTQIKLDVVDAQGFIRENLDNGS